MVSDDCGQVCVDAPAQPVGEDGDGLGRRDVDGAQADAGHDGHGQDEQPGEAQDDGTPPQGLERAVVDRRVLARQVRGGHGQPASHMGASAGKSASSSPGWMARASEARPWAQARAGARHGHVVDRPDVAR